MVKESEAWEEMFSIQYDLCLKIDTLVKDAFEDKPELWRVMGLSYVMEHLAEMQRWNIEIPEKSLKHCNCGKFTTAHKAMPSDTMIVDDEGGAHYFDARPCKTEEEL